jgi:type IV pilus assembly protein PilV
MRKQRGTSLIEVLVTILIVSFGMLGVAGVVGMGLKGNHSSYGRTQASLLAADIVDRMRANRLTAQAAAKPYDLALTGTPSGTTIPAQDLIAWRAALAAALPSGTGSVSMNATTLKVTVLVQWDESRVAGGSATQNFTLETRL